MDNITETCVFFLELHQMFPIKNTSIDATYDLAKCSAFLRMNHAVLICLRSSSLQRKLGNML